MLTTIQIACIILLLQAFGVDPSVVTTVQSELVATQNTSAISNSSISPVNAPIATMSAPATIPVMNPTIQIGRVNYDNGLGGLYYRGSAAIDPSQVHVSQNGHPVGGTVSVAGTHDQGENSFLVTNPDGTTTRVVGGVSMTFSISPALDPGEYDVSIIDASGATIFSSQTTVD